MARATRRADGWALVALDLDLDTRNPAGRKAAAALMEAGRWRGEPTRQGIEEARERGAKLGRPRALAPKTLARIRELRSGGESFRSIAATLNDEKIPGSQGGRWHERSVRRALRLYGERDT
jgi:DNA invertase Pin-like site-specific DNA recombinase